MRRRAPLAALVLLMSGCVAGPAPDAVAALRPSGHPQDLPALEAAAARLVGATRVDLAVDAFEAEPELALDRRRLRTLAGVADGLDLSAPLRLRLERLGDVCRLLHVGTGESVPLADIACIAAEH